MTSHFKIFTTLDPPSWIRQMEMELNFVETLFRYMTLTETKEHGQVIDAYTKIFPRNLQNKNFKRTEGRLPQSKMAATGSLCSTSKMQGLCFLGLTEISTAI